MRLMCECRTTECVRACLIIKTLSYFLKTFSLLLGSQNLEIDCHLKLHTASLQIKLSNCNFHPTKLVSSTIYFTEPGKTLLMSCTEAVSYTHLDVYKRQVWWTMHWNFLPVYPSSFLFFALITGLTFLVFSSCALCIYAVIWRCV